MSPPVVAALYKHQPPLLATAAQQRVITEAGRELISVHSTRQVTNRFESSLTATLL
ncbi:MAG: hypothetical protein ACRDRL_33265 [Sciscionella sp.]